MNGITLWLHFKDGHVERKWFSSSMKAVSWLENHPKVVSVNQLMSE